MSFQRWVVVGSCCMGVSFACAEAQDEHSDSSRSDAGTANGASEGGGKGGAGGSKDVSEGGISSGGKPTTSAGASGAASGGTGGASNGGAGSAGAAGKAGSSSGGTGGASSGGSAGASNGGGSGTTGLRCTLEAAGGALGEGGGDSVGGESSGGAGSVGGAASEGGAPASSLFFEDFEADASRWKTTLGAWSVVTDGTQVYEQAQQDNKLQIAIADDTCLEDQIIEAKLKVIGFKGQSSSYAAALFGRVIGAGTHYVLALGSDGKLALRKRVNSTSTSATAIGSAKALTIAAGTWYDLRFELVGTSLKGCVGDVCVTGTDSSIASGGVAVGTVNTSARFDDVRVTAP